MAHLLGFWYRYLWRMDYFMHIFNFHKHVLSDLNGYHFSVHFCDEAYNNNFVAIMNLFSRPTASRVFGQEVNSSIAVT
jgi:hypothetical protein